jgi:transcriptional regulator with XRE-family HTH domain
MQRHPHEGQKALGEAIRSLRKNAGLTQDALARRSELHEVHINRIEKGYVDPTYGNVRRIAKGLGVSLERLAEEEARVGSEAVDGQRA